MYRTLALILYHLSAWCTLIMLTPLIFLSSVKKGSVLVTRMESLTAYKNKHGQHKSGKMFMTLRLSLTFATMHKILDCLIFKTVKHFTGTQKQSNTHVSDNDMCTLDEWPSHARRNRPQPHNGTFVCLCLSPCLLHCNTITSIILVWFGL